MVLLTMDSKSTERGHGISDSHLPSGDKQLPIAAKKTALRELRNDNSNIIPSLTKNLPLKDKDPAGVPCQVAGTKRPLPPLSEFSGSPSQNLVPGVNAVDGQLVYVRRKSEAEPAKSGTGDLTNTSPDRLQSTTDSIQEEPLRQQPNIKEPETIFKYPAFASLPLNSSTGSSTKLPVPVPIGMSGVKMGSSAEPNYVSVASSGSPMDSRALKNLPWEERYKRLQKLLNDVEQADHREYLQMLRSLSSVDLSCHAVNLEKRSIQLSLEEAKEMLRVASLNVLGKSVNS